MSLRSIVVDGQPLQAPAGATLAAVLAAQGDGQTRVSVRGDARAPLCGMGVCHECSVEVDGQRRLACQTLVAEGQQVRRRGTVAPEAALPPMTRTTREDCDLLIVGAGPAGLAAAAAAARSGARIVVLDDNPAPGGQVWRQGVAAPAGAALRAAMREFEAASQVRLWADARVVARNGDGILLVDRAGHFVQLGAARIVLCTGARELLLPFEGWTLPGVTGAGALQALVKNGLPVAGQRIVIAGSGPLLLAAAATLRAAGAQVLRVAEQASWASVARFASQLPRWPGKLWQSLQLATPVWRAGTSVQQALGDGKLTAVELLRDRHRETLACERLACGWGLVPNTELGQLLGCALDAQAALAVDAVQATSVGHIWAAGECTGIGGSERAAVQGAIAGHAAIGDRAAAQALQPQARRWQAFADAVARHFPAQRRDEPAMAADTLLCRCEDVPLAAARTQADWPSAKLHTRCGMGPCQGRICGAAARALWGWAPGAPRHLLAPVPLGALAAID